MENTLQGISAGLGHYGDIQCPLPGERVVASLTPRIKKPSLVKILFFGLNLNIVFEVLILGLVSFSGYFGLGGPGAYLWALLIIPQAIIEHFLVKLRKKIPKIGHYNFFLTDNRVVLQILDKKQRVQREVDIPRRKLGKYLIKEEFRTKHYRRSPLFLFYGVIFVFIAINMIGQVWILDYVYLASVFVVLITGVVLIKKYMTIETKVKTNRSFKVYSLGGYQVEVPPDIFSDKCFNTGETMDFFSVFRNLTNEIDAVKYPARSTSKTTKMAESDLNLGPAPHRFSTGKDEAKAKWSRQLKKIFKYPSLDGSFVLVLFLFSIVYILGVAPEIYPSRVDPAIPNTLIQVVLFLGVVKILHFLVYIVKFSSKILGEDYGSLAKNTPFTTKKYRNISLLMYGAGALVGLYWGDPSKQEYLADFFTYAGIFFGVFLALAFAVYSAVMGILTILASSGVERVTTTNNARLIRVFRRFDVRFHSKLYRTTFLTDGNFTINFRKIMVNEQTLYYLIFVITLFCLGMVNPSMFTGWADSFGMYMSQLREFLRSSLDVSFETIFIQIVFLFVGLLGIVVVIIFAYICRHFVFLREPNMALRENEGEAFSIQSKSIGAAVALERDIRRHVLVG
ncbi:MAG: hypothetical protein ACTSU5_04235, partial [Promethearchaeota archaeon]